MTAQKRVEEMAAKWRARAAANRAAMPRTAEMLEYLESYFGPGFRVRYAVEDDKTMGKPGPKGVPLSDPPPRRKRA